MSYNVNIQTAYIQLNNYMRCINVFMTRKNEHYTNFRISAMKLSVLLPHVFIHYISCISSFELSSNSAHPNIPPSEYNECFKTRGCYGIPAGCIATVNCKILVTYKIEETGDVSFTLQGNVFTWGIAILFIDSTPFFL